MTQRTFRRIPYECLVFLSAFRDIFHYGLFFRKRVLRALSSSLLLGLLASGPLVDVWFLLPCRSSLAEQAGRGDRVPASPPPPAPEHHLSPAVPPHLQDTTEFPTPPPTPPERHTPEAPPTPPASPCIPPAPLPAPASPPLNPASQCEDRCPAAAPCPAPLRYAHELSLTLTVISHSTGGVFPVCPLSPRYVSSFCPVLILVLLACLMKSSHVLCFQPRLSLNYSIKSPSGALNNLVDVDLM